MRSLLITSIGITLLLAICTFDDFLCLHDIRADYVSKSVLAYLHIETTEPLPEWTDTKLEWTSISISFVVRSILILANLLVLVLLVKQFRATRSAAFGQK